MNEDPLVALEQADGIARIRLNRPRALNAIDAALARALLAAVRTSQANGARVVVLGGEGRAFLAGGDLQAFAADPPRGPVTARAIIGPLHEAVALLAEGDAPVIAAVHGAVAGAGLSLVLGADLVLAADTARFSPAYVRIGACQDGGGSWALPRAVGLHKAMEIALLAEPFDAQAALAMGIVNRVVAADRLEAEATALARRIADGPTRAYGHTRRLLRAAASRSLREQLDAERTAFAACAATSDFAEGVRAFFDKRSPHFVGR